MTRLQSFGLLAALLVALPGQAQEEHDSTKVEITPMATFLLEGNFDDGFDDDDFFDDELEVDEGNGLGLIVGFKVSRHFDVELSYSRSDTTLTFDDGLFNLDDIIEADLIDLDIEYFHVGANVNFGGGQVRPFLMVSAGATRFSPDSEFDDEVRPSVGFGGGIKVYFQEHFGARIQGRLLSTLIDDGEDAFCNRHGCVEYDADTYLYQAELSAGLIFAF